MTSLDERSEQQPPQQQAPVGVPAILKALVLRDTARLLRRARRGEVDEAGAEQLLGRCGLHGYPTLTMFMVIRGGAALRLKLSSVEYEYGSAIT